MLRAFDWNIYSIMYILAIVVIVNLVIFILSHHYSSLSTFWFLIILTVAIILGVSQFFLQYSKEDQMFRFWNFAYYFADVAMPPVFLTFVLSFVGKENILRKYSYFLSVCIPTLIIFFLGATTDTIIVNNINNAVLHPWGYDAAKGNLYFILNIYRVYYYVPIIFILIYFLSTVKDKIKKKRYLWILLATLCPAFGSTLIISILDIFTDINQVPAVPIIVIFSTIGIVLTTIGISRYGVSLFNPITLAQTVFETMNEGVIGVGSSFTIEFVNRGAEKLLGLSNHSLEKKSLKEIFNEKTIQEKLIQPLEYQNISTINEFEFRNYDGKKIQIKISASKIINDDKTTEGYILVLTDIKELEEKIVELENLKNQLKLENEIIEKKVVERTHDLEHEKAKLESSINNLNIGFVLTDINNQIVKSNKAATEILKTTPPLTLKMIQNLLGKDWNIEQSIKQSLETKQSIIKRDIFINDKYINFFISQVMTEDNEIIGNIIVMEDITETKRMERSKEEFFTIASHELRTPLTAIAGYVSLIKQLYFPKLDSEDLKSMVTNIGISSTRLIKMVNEFLDTSKLEQGKMNIHINTVDLNKIIIQSIQECLPLAQEKNLYIKYDASGIKYSIVCDSEKTKQVLINLISNAIKFTDIGGIDIYDEIIENNFIKIRVKDSGKGINKENKDLLFKKFQQANNDIYARQSEGTGLGLYISKLLIEKMNGQIALEYSKEGEGTEFSFTLPLAK